jgi:hypothetical protein
MTLPSYLFVEQAFWPAMPAFLQAFEDGGLKATVAG